MPAEAVCSAALRWSLQGKLSQLKAPPLTKFFEEGSVCSWSRLSSEKPEAITESVCLLSKSPTRTREGSLLLVTSDSTECHTPPACSSLRGGSPESPGQRSEQSRGSDIALQADCHSRLQTEGKTEKRRREGERGKGDRSGCSCLGSRTSQMTIGISIRTP